MLCKVS
jgi:hypothetical protein